MPDDTPEAHLRPDQLTEMDGRMAVVRTASGRVISVGRLVLSQPTVIEEGARVSLHFETETMRCNMRVPMDRLAALAASWNGQFYHYVLPEGDRVWLPPADALDFPSARGSQEPIIETFPLPTKYPRTNS